MGDIGKVIQQFYLNHRRCGWHSTIECSSEIQNDKVRRDGRRMDEIDCIDCVYLNESTSNDVRRTLICARRLMSEESLSNDVNNANSIAERISNIELLKQRLKTHLFRQSFEIPDFT